MNLFKIKRSLILVVAIMGFSVISCRSYQNLSDVPAPDANGLVRDTLRGSDTTSIATIPWKVYFSDPLLQQLIQEGLQANLDMKIALTSIKQAEANLWMANGANLPSLSAGWQLTHTRTSHGSGTSLLGASTSTNQLGFSASWEVDLWGKLNSQSKVRYATYLNSVENRNLVQTNLVASIAKAYYTLLALDRELQITRETVLTLGKSAETIRSLMESGQQNAAAVEQSKALLYSTKLSIPALETQIRQQENALCVLLGRKPGRIERTSIDNQAVSAQLAYGVPAQMLSRRPDVKQAELTLKSAYSSVDLAKANFYPSLTITSASLGFAGGFTDLIKPANIAANIVGGLTQPIFSKRQLKGNLKVAQAQQESALLSFQNAVLKAGQEVSDILFSYQSSLSKNEDRQNQIQSLLRSVDYTQELLKAGEATYTEVLSAQRDLLSAQLNQVVDKQDQLTYSVNLYKALGGGGY